MIQKIVEDTMEKRYKEFIGEMIEQSTKISVEEPRTDDVIDAIHLLESRGFRKENFSIIVGNYFKQVKDFGGITIKMDESVPKNKILIFTENAIAEAPPYLGEAGVIVQPEGIVTIEVENEGFLFQE